ncbi:MAG TPA: A/G-specific adenine glycosylase [Candidatus Eisenbacteria bacterium]|nr:A/G-specific adenine glycosylase [Candidatus Eisenbacteria bacterium]
MSFQPKLLRWFEASQRPLPWRRRYRPYEVWISEIMLQQTQMETVLPYYRRWMKAFPTVEALARADEKKVLKAWEGLGYYSRARNLHETARRIVAEFGGKFPEDFETLLSLKGVGRYSAGAIASIAYNRPRPIVDGNVLRVLSRLFAIADPIDTAAGREGFWDLEESLIPEGRARDFNQALMELGALVCAPRNPGCGVCPLASDCVSLKLGNPESYPVRSARKKTVKVHAGAVVLKNQGRYLLRLRPVGKIMGGLWEFPEWKLAQNRHLDAEGAKKKTAARARRELSVKADLRHLGSIRRNYTHFQETMDVFAAELESGDLRAKDGWESVWASGKEFASYPFSAAHARIAELVRKNS